MKMYYFRDFREIELPTGKKLYFSKLTLLERFSFSVYLTHLKSGNSKPISSIVFGDNLTKANYKEMEKIFNILLSKIEICAWIKENLSNVYNISFDTEKIFATQLGFSKKDLNQIAFRAFILASAKSMCKGKNPLLDTIQAYQWADAECKDLSEASPSFKKNMAVNYKRLRENILKWAKAAEVKVEFISRWSLKVEGFLGEELDQEAPEVASELSKHKELPVKQEEAKEPAKEELPDKQEKQELPVKQEERTDFQKYCDERLIEDSFEIERKWKRAKKDLEAKKIDPTKFMLKCEKELKLKETLDKIARNFCGERSCMSTLEDKFLRGEKLYLKEGKEYRDLIEELKSFSKKLWTACESDEEDERAFDDETLRAYCLIYLKKYYSWLLSLTD